MADKLRGREQLPLLSVAAAILVSLADIRFASGPLAPIPDHRGAIPPRVGTPVGEEKLDYVVQCLVVGYCGRNPHRNRDFAGVHDGSAGDGFSCVSYLPRLGRDDDQRKREMV